MENINMIEKQKKIFTLEEAKDFFKKNSFKFPENMEIQHSLRCIDDRSTEKGIAIPGAALGVYMAVFDAVSQLEKKFSIEIDPGKISEVIHSVIGGSIHTDEKNVQNEASCPVAGCGHCNGILKERSLDPKYLDFLEGSYLKKLEDEISEPVIYKGSHDAKAVFIVNDLETGTVSNSGADKAFVYNKVYHLKILNDVGNKVFSFLKDSMSGISNEEFNKLIVDSAEKQLQKTLDHLTKGLPVFISSDL